MTQYEAIFQRSSVRKFQMRPLDAKVMEQLNLFMQSVITLHADASYRIAVIEACGNEKPNPEVKRSFSVEAPYYLVLSGKEHPYSAKNAGFVMEQIVLYLTTKGIGTCYLGNAKPAAAAENYKNLIVVAFGSPLSPNYRIKPRRKPLKSLVYYKEEISEQAVKILEAARLAPSARNSQPWRFVVYSQRIHIFMKRRNHLVTKHWKVMQEISMGILMTHMALTAEEQWLNWRLKAIENVAERELKGYEYVATLLFSEQDFLL